MAKIALHDRINTTVFVGVLTIIAIMPFHAFLVTWISSTMPNNVLVHLWKELLILLLSIFALGLLLKNPPQRKALIRSRVNQLVLVYVVLHILFALFGNGSWVAIATALKTNLNFLLLFLLAQIAAYGRPVDKTESVIEKIVVGTGVAVGVFGMMQILVLPNDWLSNFGYGDSTIPAFLLVDNQPTFLRILSTTSGPNQLSSFLILPILITIGRLLRSRRWIYMLLLMPMLFSNLFTFSRSGWLGLAAGILIIICMTLSKKQSSILITSTLIALAVGLWAFSLVGSSAHLETLILHSKQSDLANSVGSTADHLDAVSDSIRKISARPIGYGLASAGTASLQTASPFITENYYLQIGIEVGIQGLLVFVGICLLVARKILQIIKSSSIALPLLGALLGISIINLFLHGWNDSTTSLIWWGTAGILIGLHAKKTVSTG